jgi:hypothetical protein
MYRSIGFALAKDLNENLDAFSTFIVGQKVQVEVKGVYKGIHERNLLQVVREKKQTPKRERTLGNKGTPQVTPKKGKSPMKKSPKVKQ